MAQARQTTSPAPLQGVLLLLLSALLGLAFYTRGTVRPACGPLVDWVAVRLVGQLGVIAAWALWAVLPPAAVLWFLGRSRRGILRFTLGLLPLIAVTSVLVSPIGALEGALGTHGLSILKAILGPYGSWIVLAAFLIVSGWFAWRICAPPDLREAVAERFDRAGRAPRVKIDSGRTRPPKPSRAERSATPLRLLERPPAPSAPPPDGDEERISEEEPAAAVAASEPRIRTRRPTPARAPAPVRFAEAAGDWKLPDASLLEELDGTRAAIDRDEILETSKVLTRTLLDFGVAGRVGEVHPGPVVTSYEFEPGTGIRVNQIVSRQDDLALALRAPRIRLVAPIPGKAAVGIEVPNRRPALISLKEILDSEEFRTHEGPLVMALGREISGAPIFTRLDAMPHLLVAGTTGSGKSVCLNGLLLSLLFRHTPAELRLLLIDPKRIELTPFDGIPSLLCPVVTEPRHATRMLEWLCTEMDRRYRLLRQAGARNVDAYTRRAPKAGEVKEPLPYLVVVVDELADLMLTQGIEIEGPISRLAHMARAVGIHMILATQRPSVDVITGVIKANFPARIAFQVASRIDSRTILDAGGAECLLGRGDMLFVPPGKGEAVRVHGAYCTDGDAERVAAFLREQPAAPGIVPDEQEEGESADPTRGDELFGEAMRIVVREQQASVSFLQRRLKVGYARAARLMDLLEAAGVVSPYDGSKAREVMVDERFLEDWERRQGPSDGSF